LGLFRIKRRQLGKRRIQVECLGAGRVDPGEFLVQRHPPGGVRPFAGLRRTGMVDQRVAHQPRGEGIEVTPVLEIRFAPFHQPQKQLIDQYRRLKRMAAALASKEASGQLFELRIDQRREPIQGAGISGGPF